MEAKDLSLGASFNLVPQYDGEHLIGQLNGAYVDVDPSGIMANIGAFLGHGTSLLSVQSKFARGLRKMANEFALFVEEYALLPLGLDNPRPISTAIDLDSQDFVITFCDPSPIIQVIGYFPADSDLTKIAK